MVQPPSTGGLSLSLSMYCIVNMFCVRMYVGQWEHTKTIRAQDVSFFYQRTQLRGLYLWIYQLGAEIVVCTILRASDTIE